MLFIRVSFLTVLLALGPCYTVQENEAEKQENEVSGRDDGMGRGAEYLRLSELIKTRQAADKASPNALDSPRHAVDQACATGTGEKQAADHGARGLERATPFLGDDVLTSAFGQSEHALSERKRRKAAL